MRGLSTGETPNTLLPEAMAPKSQAPSRRETILSLVEMLLQEDGRADRREVPSFEDDKDVPTVDEHFQTVGAEAFNNFERRCNNLDKELRNLANTTRHLGGSVAILSPSLHLRERLAQVLVLYRQNAAELFPRKITRVTSKVTPEPTIKRRSKAFSHVTTVDQDLDIELFPEQLEALAKDLATFLDCLNDFSQFTDEAVNISILSFEGDLKYWASCLKEHAGHFRYPPVARYIHDLSMEMVEHIDSITLSLSMFIEVGIPTIRFAQKHGETTLLNLSTVAIFFSAVTATTLQFSVELTTHTAMADAVNCFWFASLVFSIAAAVNSLLGLTWKQAMYRAPRHRVPHWVLIWIKSSPLMFLVMSIACFSVGLCCFAYASEQASATSALTTVCTTFTSSGLAAVSAWFALERYMFIRHEGKKYLSDVLTEYQVMLSKFPGVHESRQVLNSIGNQLSRWSVALQRSCSKLHGIASSSSSDLEASLPAAYIPFETILQQQPQVSYQSPVPLDGIIVSPEPTPPSPGQQLWKNALRTVKMHSSMIPSHNMSVGTFHEPPQRTIIPPKSTGGHGERTRTTPGNLVKAVFRSRITALQLQLKQLEPVQDVAAHQALVRHLQFSPDGKYLATASWDRTTVIFQVGDPLVSHRILPHAQGFVGQVAWSPTGNTLLTRLGRSIKVWNAESGVCRKTIDRKRSVESITWFPDGKALISVEGSDVTKLDLNGNILDQYDFGRMKLHDVAVTPDSLRLIGVGPLLESPTGLQPIKSRAEKRLVVYNMKTNQIENQTPVLNDVRDITVTQTPRSGVIALISYENKAPPQLWKLEMVKDRENNAIVTGRLTLRHTYMPKVQVDFAGPSYFGGKNNELVLCAGKVGDIHIWDQESGALLHHVRGQAHGGDLTCIAWNQAAEDPFMFATGSHDGAVRIWTRLPEEIDSGYPSPTPPTNAPSSSERDGPQATDHSNHPYISQEGSRPPNQATTAG